MTTIWSINRRERKGLRPRSWKVRCIVLNSRPHLYYPRNYYLGRLLVAFIAAIVPKKTPGLAKTTNATSKRRRVIVTLVICFVVLELTPIGLALYRNWRWEHNQQPTT